MIEEKNTWGGARKGAGRPALLGKRKTRRREFRLCEEADKILDSVENATLYIESAVLEKYNRKTTNAITLLS